MATRKKKVIKPISSGTIPFDNGKVKMGIYYQKPKYVEYDKDMLNLQTYLIGDPVKLKRNYYITRAFELLGAVVLLIILLKGNS
jgi:hypothetical protein